MINILHLYINVQKIKYILYIHKNNSLQYYVNILLFFMYT